MKSKDKEQDVSSKETPDNESEDEALEELVKKIVLLDIEETDAESVIIKK